MIGVYVSDLEKMREFYVRYFHAAEQADNSPSRGRRTCCLDFKKGRKLRLIQKQEEGFGEKACFEMDFHMGSQGKVNAVMYALMENGYETFFHPRRSRDEVYGGWVVDPEGNHIEVIV